MAISSQDSEEALSEMNVTPLVDVMLVLLVIFIVTAPLMTNAIKVTLPKTEAVAPLDQKDPVTVSVDKQGRYFIDKEEVGFDALQPRLARLKASDPETRVRLQADGGVDYSAVAKALASVERAGITRVAVLTSR
ncbi:ExbD/TolR family protein [Xylophilus ampelinus]|uniref:Outer membrane transport energization protein ExbD n=1 Tax=Xylophilus ampelinus TaxID=54067 RepID=A0A318SGE9_9BURK|nr:biopolymer transporter ExbD [Xylophilus ampelinus]MCS4510451.1 biopolymer transporter ExbD [Xylophilus ampelinus]PYE77904.1 outer membrane transport energization protein ExbD [Xylophilus ampelinus]